MNAERIAIPLMDDIVPTERIPNHYCASNMDIRLLKTAEIITLATPTSSPIMLLCAYEMHNPVVSVNSWIWVVWQLYILKKKKLNKKTRYKVI